MNGLPSEEIKSRLDILDVLSGYIRVQKQGSSYRALCPFHNEKTPSFHVSVPRQMWHCFGCGEGGDIFTFVMKMEGIEFVDAMRILAKKAGVVLKAQDPKLVTERANLEDICAQATRFFENNFESERGGEARAYLLGRGLAHETMKEFHIGYAPASWDGLLQFLAIKGYKHDAIEKAGLAVKSEKSGTAKYYDKFRDRIMFPIADANGTIVAFTGRYLTPKEGEGKYVNSPQTMLYNKSAILYGLDRTKTDIKKKDRAVLVEGQMDMLMAWQDGVKNVAAVSGTAFTASQLQLLGRFTKNLCIFFDADIAGDAATKKSIALAQEHGFSVSVGRIAEGKDPADFVLEHRGELERAVEKAVSIMDYYFETASARHDRMTLDGKKAIAAMILPVIKKIGNKIETHHWLEKLSSVVATDMASLEEELHKVKLDDAPFADGPLRGGAEIQKREMPKKTSADKLLVHLMALVRAGKNEKEQNELFGLLSPFLLLVELGESARTADDIVSPVLCEVFTVFFKYGKVGKLQEDFSVKLSEEGKGIAREIQAVSELLEYPNVREEILSCARRIERELVDRELKRLSFALKNAETENNPELSENLLKEVSMLSQRKKELFV